jgi:methyl-accepting chemotaxis protein
MKSLKDVRIEVKIIGIAVGISLFALLVGVIGLMNMAKINQMSTQIYQKELLGVSRIKEAYINLICVARAEKNVMLAFAKKDKLRYIKIHDNNEALFLSNVKGASSLLETEQEKDTFSKLENAWAEYSTVSKQVVDLAAAEDLNASRPSIELAMGPAREKINAVTDALEELTRMKEDNAKKLSGKAAAIYKSSRLVMAGIITGGVILGIVLGVLLSFLITGPLKKIIENLSNGADQVASASIEVSNASQDLAEGASEQAASIEETSASMEEMSSMTKLNEENANHANRIMKETELFVERATASMKQLSDSMKKISEASEETSKIIKTIDEISFQTNLLALNAAVEAARAGEAGAGFAVVANEVRNLAVRAAEAAKNTSTMIEGTLKRVKEGSEILVHSSGEFSQMADSALKAGDLVERITVASGEQSTMIEQIKTAFVEMSQVVQGTAANAEESASASEELSAQAKNMRESVNDLVQVIGGRKRHEMAESREMNDDEQEKMLPPA